MILKNFEVNKINIKKKNYYLLYGNNKGFINQVIKENFINKFNNNIYNYDESDVINNKSNFFDQILNNSFFENNKLIIISRTTDKSKVIIEEIIDKKISDIVFVFVAETLEKKSKLRKFFEDDKNTICIAFYPDTNLILSKIASEFFRERKISISQSNINLIISKCNNDRGNLVNELNKIELLSLTNKKITTENILQLVNLNENHSIFSLVDNCLLKNQKKVIDIVNENIFGIEDCIIILKTFLSKTKKLLKLAKEFETNKNIDETISKAKPPIFWKEKEMVKNQIINWSPMKIKKLIFNLNEIELQIKKNNFNPVNITLDFILEQSAKN